MKVEHPLIRRVRARGAVAFLGLLMAVLTFAFFKVQVVTSSTYQLQSESNRLRPLAVPAPRGTIFDRTGRVIVDNVPGYAVSLFPAPVDSHRVSLKRLQPYLDLSDSRIEYLLGVARRYRRQPLLVDGDADFDGVAALEERRGTFPGVVIEMVPKRRYFGGAAAGHVLGYVGEVTSEELDTEEYADYEQGMLVGKAGLELQYEASLQGARGVRYVEVDASGRIVGSFRGRSATKVTPGEDARLTLDLDLMEWIHHIFPDTARGAVVALDVADGGVLALYSAPSFDPNAFVGGIDVKEWESLISNPDQPLFNRAIQGLYSPGSTWKLATAAIAIDLGVVTPREFMPQPCTGGLQYGNRFFHCWKADGHGFLDLAGAIQNSCNVYFYQLGLRVGLDALLEGGNRIGFADYCGVDLPGEAAGQFPANRDFWQQRWGYRANESEVLSLAIGQGPNEQTPLKMAQFNLALARNGTAPAPHLRQDVSLDGGWSLDLSDESLFWLREGIRRVTGPGGTAHMSSLEHWDLLGKTGTVQNSADVDRPHAYFTGMAGPWGEDPEIVVVVVVEQGLSGSGAAAPLAAKIADHYLRSVYGIPQDTIQTLGEHLRRGRPAPWARWVVEVAEEPAPEPGAVEIPGG